MSRDVAMTSSTLTLPMLTLLCVGVTVTSADGGKCVCLSVCVCVNNELASHDTIRYEMLVSQLNLPHATNNKTSAENKNILCSLKNEYAQKYR